MIRYFKHLILRAIRKSLFFLIFKFIKLVLLVFLACLIIFYYSELNGEQQTDEIGQIHRKNYKAVQLLTDYFRYENWGYKALGEYPFITCPERRCHAFKPFRYAHTPLEKADAVVVNANNLFYMPSKTTYQRRKKQIWVYHSMESEHMSFCSFHYHITELDDWFNLTMTFKPDSDYVADYRPHDFENWPSLTSHKSYVSAFEDLDKVEQGIKEFRQDMQHQFVNKRRKPFILWFVSNCWTRSGREDFVNEMSKYVDIDIFSECTNLKSAKPDPCKKPLNKSKECYFHLFKSYKFYLSFENSKCNHYITEKFWKIYEPSYLFSIDIVPVVRGARESDYERIAFDKKAYINADNFDSPKGLAGYLNYLNDNFTAYMTHINWKLTLIKQFKDKVKANDKQSVDTKDYNVPRHSMFCALCAKLHDENFLNNQNNKIVKISEWFNPELECSNNQDYPSFIRKNYAKMIGMCV